MKKKSVDIKNQFIPHPMQLFLVGTYDENKNPNIGMFCWISFCWDGELSVPMLQDSPLCYELKVKQTIHLDGSEIFIGSIENTMADEEMIGATGQYNLAQTNPAIVSQMQYFGLNTYGQVGNYK